MQVPRQDIRACKQTTVNEVPMRQLLTSHTDPRATSPYAGCTCGLRKRVELANVKHSKIAANYAIDLQSINRHTIFARSTGEAPTHSHAIYFESQLSSA
jgi:hypothetical protein